MKLTKIVTLLASLISNYSRFLFLLEFSVLEQELANFFIKDQIANVLGLYTMPSIVIAQLCHHSRKKAIDDT